VSLYWRIYKTFIVAPASDRSSSQALERKTSWP
jgi:hypothetical protein